MILLAATLVGSLAVARVNPVGTLLRDGRVLIVGGSDGHGALVPQVEIYDPHTRSFRTMTAQPSGTYSSSVLLDDGRVLFGVSVGNPPVPIAEIYDPQTDRFTRVPPAQAHLTAPLVKLPDGRVLVGGGLDATFKPSTAVEIFNPATNAWSAAGDLQVARNNHAALLLRDGRVLFGGGQGVSDFPPTEIFDPNTKTSIIASTDHLGQPIGARLADGRAMIMNVGSVYILDEFANTLKFLTTLPTGFQAAVPLPSGMLLLAGGADLTGGGPTSKILVVNPDNGSYTEADDLNVARIGAAGVLLSDGSVLIAGGATNSVAPIAVTGAAELFNPPPRSHRAVKH